MSESRIEQSHIAFQKAYGEMVTALNKPGEEIIIETTPLKAQLNHMTLLLAGETGELVDAIKKHTIYDKDLDYINIVEEMGDIEFALEALRQLLTISRDEVLSMNVEKLSTRYPSGSFSNAQAKARADKQIELDVETAIDNGVVDHE